jgi:hypothetical protein
MKPAASTNVDTPIGAAAAVHWQDTGVQVPCPGRGPSEEAPIFATNARTTPLLP